MSQMLSWLKRTVTSREDTPVSAQAASQPVSYESLGRQDEDETSVGDSKPTFVVVREGAVPKRTLEQNENQLLSDIPEFKPFILDNMETANYRKIDAESLLVISKQLQGHMTRCADGVITEQDRLNSKMSQVEVKIKTLLDRFSERQRSYAKAAEQLKRTSDITHSLKRLRYNIKQTEEMMRQLNEQLPKDLQLEPYSFYNTSKPKGK